MGHYYAAFHFKSDLFPVRQPTKYEDIYIYFFPCLQVHGLDPDTWKDVEVVYIDIADKRQIDSKVCDLKKTNKPSLGVIILFILNL